MTTLVHGSAALDAVVAASQAIFGRGELAGLDAATLAGVADSVPSAAVEVGTTIVDALVACGLAESRSEARRFVADGGAYVNNESVADPDMALTPAAAIAGGWAVLRRGKKTVAMVRIGE